VNRDGRLLVAKVRRAVLALAALIALLGLAGCGVAAQTAPDEVALRYSGNDIALEAEKFIQCYGPSDSDRGGFGDKVYTYPAGQRSYKFATVTLPDGSRAVEPGADGPAIQVTAAGGITLSVNGVVTFTPQFQNCDTLRDFHERIGRKYGAYLRGEDDATTTVVEGAEGWTTMLNTYVKDPTERALDNASLGYDPFALSTDPTTKTAWEKAALEGIPLVMKQQSGGEFFKVDSVLLQAPQLPQAMVDGQVAKQTAQQQADAAAIAQTAAGACNELCQEYQLNQALTKAINDGRVQVWPVPVGANVQLPAPAPR
jgi:hypothetical protein